MKHDTIETVKIVLLGAGVLGVFTLLDKSKKTVAEIVDTTGARLGFTASQQNIRAKGDTPPATLDQYAPGKTLGGLIYDTQIAIQAAFGDKKAKAIRDRLKPGA